MSDGQTPASFDTSYAYRKAMESQGQGGSGFSGFLWLLGGLLGPVGRMFGRDVNVGASLSPQGKGLNADKTVPISRAQPGICAKLLESTGFNRKAIFEGIAKCNAPVQQASIDQITGPNIGHNGGGASFTTMVSGSGDDGGRGA